MLHYNEISWCKEGLSQCHSGLSPVSNTQDLWRNHKTGNFYQTLMWMQNALKSEIGTRVVASADLDG